MAKKRVFGGVNDVPEEVNQFFESGGKAMDEPAKEEKDAPKLSEAEPKAQPLAAKETPAPAPAESEGGEQPKGEQLVDKVKPATPPEGFVPHGALHEEREKRKKAEAEFRQFKTEREAKEKLLEDRLNALYEKAKPPVPDFQQDPANHLAHKLAEAERQIAEFNQFRQQSLQERQQMTQREQFIASYQAAASEFTQAKPDFMQAYNHLTDNRIQDIVAMGYPLMQARQIAMQEEAAVVNKAFQDGVNPAERLYALAQRRGYTNQPNNGKSEVNPGAEKLKQVEKGLKSNPDANSNSQGKSKLTLEAIANMDDAEFAKLDWDKVRELAA